MNLSAIQNAIREHDVDGWLFYDFRERDPLAMSILGMPTGKFLSRRWYYYIPATGDPVKLVSKVEESSLDDLPGDKLTYLSWKEQHQQIRSMIGDGKRIACNYSPMNHIPYTSMLDAGTVDVLRSLGLELVSAANLIQQFEALLDDAAFQTHAEAGEMIMRVKDEAFRKISAAVEAGELLNEFEVQQFIMQRFEQQGFTCDGHGPIVGINDHPANPHFEPQPLGSAVFQKGDMVLIDLWAKKKTDGAIYYDVTWCGYIGDNPPAKYVEIFNVVRDARNAAKQFVMDKFAAGEPCFGWEVDDACRNVVIEAGYGDYFIHRTGHSIGTNVHGNGVNIDNLETRDERQLVPGICFSIEPGIYIRNQMGVRSEINVFIKPDGEVTVVGDEQDRLILM